MADENFGAIGTCDKATSIYGLIDPRTGELRYVGKTVLDPRRRLGVHRWRAVAAPHKRHSMAWILSLAAEGLKPETIVFETVPAGGDWVQAEQFWIAYFRMIGADLCNHTAGGEGQTGYRQPPEMIAKRVKRGAQNHNFGKPMPEATKVALREGQLRLYADPVRHARLKARQRAGMTPEKIAHSVSALKTAMADPEKLAAREAVRIEASRTPKARQRVGDWSRQNWQSRRQEIIAAQNAGKGEEWREKMSARKKQEWADPNSPHRLASERQRKLSDQDLRAIRARLAAGESNGSIAASYRIDPSTVSHIKAGRHRPG